MVRAIDLGRRKALETAIPAVAAVVAFAALVLVLLHGAEPPAPLLGPALNQCGAPDAVETVSGARR